MQADKLVSVVVLSYNHAAFVKECLESVLTQTYSNWELIVGDDASADNSVALIEEWAAINNVAITRNFHQINTGVGTMLNECIDISRGAYIKFIAADDVLYPTLLSKAIEFFEESEEEYGVVFSNVQCIDESSALLGRTLIEHNSRIPQGWIREALQISNFIPAPTVVIKRIVYDKIGYYVPDIKIDDYDCWLRASQFFKFHYLNEPLVYYRIHSNNISHTLDFANDTISLLIRNDNDGDLAAGIKQRIMDQYYNGKKELPVLAEYKRYFYRDKWLTFCLNVKAPYKVFRLVDRIFKKR